MRSVYHNVFTRTLRRVPILPPVTVTFAGGSYRDAPALGDDWVAISMAEELVPRPERPGDLHVRCADFRVPDVKDMDRAVRLALWHAVVEGRPIFVGCMGGTGRTGTFLGCVCGLLWPDEDPVDKVREVYKRTACETSGQRSFVRRFKTWFGETNIRRELARYVFWRQFGKWAARRMCPKPIDERVNPQ